MASHRVGDRREHSVHRLDGFSRKYKPTIMLHNVTEIWDECECHGGGWTVEIPCAGPLHRLALATPPDVIDFEFLEPERLWVVKPSDAKAQLAARCND